jgi:hypothetical protein
MRYRIYYELEVPADQAAPAVEAPRPSGAFAISSAPLGDPKGQASSAWTTAKN